MQINQDAPRLGFAFDFPYWWVEFGFWFGGGPLRRQL